MREAVNRNATRLVGTTLAAALDPETDPLKRAHLAVKLIEVADPGNQATLTVTAEQDIESLSLAQLISLSEQRGIDLSRPERPLPRSPSEPARAVGVRRPRAATTPLKPLNHAVCEGESRLRRLGSTASG
jgi:hypothetical protein